FVLPAEKVAGPRVSEVGAAAGSPAALFEFGVADTARDLPGCFGPEAGHVRFGIAAARLVAIAAARLIPLPGALGAGGGFVLRQFGRLNCFPWVHSAASSSGWIRASAPGWGCASGFGERQLLISASTTASISGSGSGESCGSWRDASGG